MSFDEETTEPGGRPVEPVLSGLAVGAGLSSCACFLGAPVAVVLGILGLRRIGASNGALRGEGWAWAGILLGVLQLGIAAVLGVNVLGELDRAGPAVADFLTGATQGEERAYRRTTSAGLQVVLGREGLANLAQAFVPLGGFQEVGERDGFNVGFDEGSTTVKVVYKLRFEKGEATGTFVLVEELETLRVKEFVVHSPILNRPIGVAGQPGQDIGEFRSPQGRN